MTTNRVGGEASILDAALLSAADGVSATPLDRAVVVNDDRFGFVEADAVDDESVPDLLTGVVCVGVVVPLGVIVSLGVLIG